MSVPIQKKVLHTLLVPVTFEGSEKTTITLRRLKGKDIREMDRIDSDLEKTFFLLGQLSDWPPEGIDELDAADFESLSKIVEGFMGRKTRR